LLLPNTGYDEKLIDQAAQTFFKINMAKERLTLAESTTFVGKNVVVTGAASGIGKAIAL
jgi:NADPH:quinone reductase-like Zn-dependent oxidoreductase